MSTDCSSAKKRRRRLSHREWMVLQQETPGVQRRIPGVFICLDLSTTQLRHSLEYPISNIEPQNDKVCWLSHRMEDRLHVVVIFQLVNQILDFFGFGFGEFLGCRWYVLKFRVDRLNPFLLQSFVHFAEVLE